MKTALLPMPRPAQPASTLVCLDTLPMHFRSEAFAEDLDDATPPRSVQAPGHGLALRLPLLGVAVAATLDWLGR